MTELQHTTRAGGDGRPVVHSSGGYTLDVVTGAVEFDALQADWDRLFLESAISVFQSFEWQRTWWKYFGEQDSRSCLHIVTIRKEGRLVGVAPFYIEKVRTLGLIPFKQLLMIGQQTSDYLDLLISREEETHCLELIASHVAAHAGLFDIVVLQDITDLSSTHTLLYNALSRMGFGGTRYINTCCPRTTLLENWEATLSSLSATHRQLIRRKNRNIRKDHSVEFELVETADHLDKDISDLVDLHQYRWTHRGHKGIFADDRTITFHKEVARLFQQRGWLFLSFLRIDGKRVAGNYAFRFRDQLTGHITGVGDAGLAWQHSPGRVLTAYSMEKAIEEGFRIYDFTRGREQYKYQFGAVDVPNWTLMMYPAMSRTADLKFKLDFLVNAIRRRGAQELLLSGHVARAEGLFSAHMAKHVATRARQTFADSLYKLQRVRVRRRSRADISEGGERGRRVGQAEYSLHVASDVREFDSLRTAWNSLFEESGVSVFQSFEWQRTWWKHFGETNPRARLHIIVVKRADRVVAIAPFFAEKVRTLGMISFDRISFLGRVMSDYLDVLTASGYEGISFNLIASHLAGQKSSCDVIFLEDFTERSPTHILFHEALIRAGFDGSLYVSEQCPRTTLRETWEETLAGFDGKHRREINRQRRHLAKNNTVEFEVVGREADIREGINDLIQLHQRRWINRGHGGVFGKPHVVDFQHEVAGLLFRQNWLFLAFLRLNGKRIGSFYGFQFNHELAFYLTGILESEEIRKYSPGTTLTSYCMEEGIKHGMRVLDFMRGTEQYKFDFPVTNVPNWSIIAYRPNSRHLKTKFKLSLLMESMHRRAKEEALLWKLMAEQYGFFSKEMAAHVSGRLWTNLKDGAQKLRAPEKSLVMGKRER